MKRLEQQELVAAYNQQKSSSKEQFFNPAEQSEANTYDQTAIQ